MSKHIAGIKPITAGCGKIEIRPQYGLYKSISCTVPAVIGNIKLDYAFVDGKSVINLDYPENAQVVMHLPDNASFTANGKAIDTKDTVITLN